MLTGKSCTLKLKIREQNLDVEQSIKFKEHLLGQAALLLELNTLDLTEQYCSGNVAINISKRFYRETNE